MWTFVGLWDSGSYSWAQNASSASLGLFEAFCFVWLLLIPLQQEKGGCSPPLLLPGGGTSWGSSLGLHSCGQKWVKNYPSGLHWQPWLPTGPLMAWVRVKLLFFFFILLSGVLCWSRVIIVWRFSVLLGYPFLGLLARLTRLWLVFVLICISSCQLL